jgi:hypothetical protein
MSLQGASMKRCTKCLLPETYPGIDFDEQGICNFCRHYEKRTSLGENAFLNLLKNYQIKKGEYDCILGVSGGRDSSYALYYLVQVCKLKVLAYTTDNGFIPEEARENIRRVTDILNVELITEKHDYLKNCMPKNLVAWMKKPSPAMILMMCNGCRYGIFNGLLKYAKKHDIPFVILGAGSGIERCLFKQTFYTANPLGKVFKKWRPVSLVAGHFYELLKNPRYLHPANIAFSFLEYVYFFQRTLLLKLVYPGQKLIFLYHYLWWDEDVILSTIKEKLDWRASADSSSTWRFDCRVSFLKNFLLSRTVGFTEKDDCLSNMIREDLLSRKAALTRLQKENKASPEIIDKLLADMNVTPDSLHRAVKNYSETHPF